MKKIFTILILLIATNSYAQKKHTISGYITDKNNGESVVGVNIYSEGTESWRYIKHLWLL